MKRNIITFFIISIFYIGSYIFFRQTHLIKSPHCEIEIAYQNEFRYYFFYPLLNTDSLLTGVCVSKDGSHGC